MDPNAIRDPPGPPPGPPPNLTEFECDDDEKELGKSLFTVRLDQTVIYWL
jgi:hypothetical protein